MQLTIPSTGVYYYGADFMECLCQASPVVHEVEQRLLLEQLQADFPDLDPQAENFLHYLHSLSVKGCEYH